MMFDCCIGVIPTILEQLDKFKSFVSLGRKEVVFIWLKRTIL